MKKMIVIMVIALIAACSTGCNNIPETSTASAATKPDSVKIKTVSTETKPVITTKPITTEHSNKNYAKDTYLCPECGTKVDEPDTLCDVCGESYYRLWGYEWVRCHIYGPDNVNWQMDNTLSCGCLPNEWCNECKDKFNHGHKTSGEKKYYEYDDFLKEKGLKKTEIKKEEPKQAEESKPIEKPTQSEITEETNGPEEPTEEEEIPCKDTTIQNSNM